MSQVKKRTKTALVTGAANGLGRAMSVGLADEEWTVLAVDRDEEGLRVLEKLNQRVVAVPADLGSSEAIKSLIARVNADYGIVDALVNNAGIGLGSIRPDNIKRPVKFWEIEETVWQRFMWLHATVPMLLASAFVTDMIDQGWGRLISITTSLDTMLKRAPYGPTKASAEALASVFAYDLENTGVTANVITPGGVTDTKMILDAAGFDRASMLRPDIMVPPLQYLLSESANAQTGTRTIAALWSTDRSDAANSALATTSIAWRSLAAPIIMPKDNSIVSKDATK